LPPSEVTPSPVPSLPASKATAPSLPAPMPATPPKPQPVTTSAPFADYPKWFQAALHEIGNREEGNNRGAAVQRYIDMAHCGALGDPWCAIFANAMLESSGVAGTRSPSSQSFRTNSNFVQLPGPAKGAVVVYWRGAKDSGIGHVGFYRGEDATRVWTLGGNESDMVQIEAMPKSSESFGLVGYWWPKSEPLPQIGVVTVAAGSPVNVQTPPDEKAPAWANNDKRQTKITATYFGGRQSAYGPAIDDNSLGVALPFHFGVDRPRVRVTNVRTGASADCDVIDVGPWNTNDPYWLKGARPQAETGTDTRGRHTNGAGIDLTLAAAKAVGIDGKGLVNWEFIKAPNVT
jgi:uncharacterized protein (TIGR02594 family)